MSRVLAVLFSILIVSTGAAMAQTPERGFEVETTLYDGDRVVGRPKVNAREHHDVIVEVAKEGGYRLRLRVDGQSGDVSSNAATVTSHIQFFRQNRWHDVASPILTVGDKGIATMRINVASGNDGRPFQIDVKLRSKVLTSAE